MNQKLKKKKKNVPTYLAIKHTHGGVGTLREALKADQVEYCIRELIW